ncbi:putative 39S ribosomal protein L2, mitochondrial [Hypsibius exemplaris]|uniref:39S ribosomal protein L2, mitochondrial n=1 Tax=Hypsibius exemplaris TaxID=2072580 RepID=A0A1W0WVA6_HYPEX|nr:putative 39S ribosomal protein L2, mitochondrial [Hypsibius exemplaris]
MSVLLCEMKMFALRKICNHTVTTIFTRGLANARSQNNNNNDPLANVPRSPFLKIKPRREACQRETKDPREVFAKPLLTPDVSETEYALRHNDYRRTFDRKDLGRKPRKQIELPPTKFDVKEWPENYTVKPLKTVRTGGRHPITGRVVYRRIGGGVYRDHLWIDINRNYIPEDRTIEEKVMEVREDPNRSGFVALIGHEDHQHWIIATENMKVGQIIKSSRAVGRMSIRAYEGDTYAVGALPIGTVVSSLELIEGHGCRVARAAGCCATILKKEDASVVIQLPSKLQVRVSSKCLATVGRVSNPQWIKIPWGTAGATRDRGIRPKSGLWHRKDGYCGRKIHPAKPLRNYLIPTEPKLLEFAFQPLKRANGLLK